MSIQNRVQSSTPSKAIQSNNVAGLVQTMMPQLQRALPAHLSADRFARLLLTELRKTPKLLQCSQESLLGSMMEVARLGLEFGDNTVHLIPYGNDVEVVVGFKGFIELAYRTGIVLKVESRVVYEGDEFTVDYQDPVHPIKTHVPKWQSKAITHVWARAQGKDGQFWYEIIPLDELNKAAGNRKGPWKDHFAEMARKTVIRRLSKQLPQSPEMAAARRIDDAVITGINEDVAIVSHPNRDEVPALAPPAEDVPAYQRRGVDVDRDIKENTLDLIETFGLED